MVNEDHSCECRHILAQGYFGSIASVSKSNGLLVGEGGNDSPPEPEAVANAHLISAAPELYDALKVFADEPLSTEPGHNRTRLFSFEDLDEKIRRARAAIAKAEGRG